MDTGKPIALASARPMRLAAVAFLFLGLGLSVLAWQHVVALTTSEAERAFDRFSVQADTAIEERAHSYLSVVTGFHGMFTVADEVSRSAFHDQFIRPRNGRWYPGLVAVQYIQRVSPESRAAFLRTVQADTSLISTGYPDFAISPPGKRGQSLVIKYSEPALDGELALGYDLATQRSLDPVLNAAAETGIPIATSAQPLTEVTQSISVYFAVYARGLPVKSAEQRRAALRGYVRGVFRANGMFDDVIPQLQGDGYRVWIEDLGATGDDRPTVVFESDAGSVADPVSALPVQDRTYSFMIADRTWIIHSSRPLPNMAIQPWPMTVLLCGIALSIAVGAVLRIVAAQYSRAWRLARQLSREAEENSQRLRSVIDHTAEGIVTIDVNAVILSANPAAQCMFGRSAEELVGQRLADLIDEPARAAMTAWLAPSNEPAADKVVEREEIALRADGSRFPLAMIFNAMDGPALGLRVGILRDVSERRQFETEMHRMAHHDELTGLPNRLLLLGRLRQAIVFAKDLGAERSHSHVGLMFIDLDRFKNINDSLGHHVGDRVLSEVACRLQSVVRAGDTVARMGGDEFVIVLPQMATATDCETVARKVRDVLASPIHADAHDLTVTVSIGLATWPDMAEDATTLMSRADAAMYRAKREGRDKWCWFDAGKIDVMPSRLRLENDLRRALERDQFVVHFQPQFDCSSGALLGAEALLRWHHPELGLVPPLEFIPLAEETGLIVPIGQWVLREALRHAVQWRAAGDAPLHVAVNLSPRQLDTDAVVSMVKEALAEFGAAPQLLELEITESAVVRDVESASGRLRQLADLGVTITIDDFGVGYSSLSYLRDLPVRKFKVDRSFVKPLPDDVGAARLVAALIAMAHQLGVGLVAEGVETEAQLAMLREFGCEAAQGYLLGKPMPADNFAALVRKLAIAPAGLSVARSAAAKVAEPGRAAA